MIYFNPRFPWGKRRARLRRSDGDGRFQSTLPVGEATRRVCLCGKVGHISIHASRGGSDLFAGWILSRRKNFNPRFPWGKRPVASAYVAKSGIFQSTLPVGEATYSPVGYSADGRISIHASRGGSDPGPRQCNGPDGYFNPRFPWGKRHGQLYTDSRDVAISIHASRGGSDDV